MVTLDVETDRRDGTTLVEGRLHHDGPDPRRVTVASELDPVLPPRREGVPEAGWDGTRLTLVVTPGEWVGFGYASPAPSADPPARVVASERAIPDGGIDSAAGVVRALGDPTPPRDVLPAPTGPPGESDDGTPDDSGDPPDHDGGETDREGVDPNGSRSPDSPPEDGLPPDVGDDLPAVAAWFAAVERRIDRADGEDDNDPVPPNLAGDARRLRAVSRRATSLADRIGTMGPGDGGATGDANGVSEHE